MSALGHKRTWRSEFTMSALPPKVDMDQPGRDVRFVPKAEVSDLAIDISHSEAELWNRNKHSYTNAERSIMPLTERVAVAWLQKPAESSLLRRPEHEIGGADASDFGTVAAERPTRPNSNFQFDFIRQGERFFE